MNIEIASANFRTMGEDLKAFAITDKQTRGYIQAQVHPEGASGASEVLPKKS